MLIIIQKVFQKHFEFGTNWIELGTNQENLCSCVAVKAFHVERGP